MPSLPQRGSLMACHAEVPGCREHHVAVKLSDAERDGDDFEARCPACGHGGFRVSKPTRSRYRHIWTCACKRCKCDEVLLRSALLKLGVMPACLGRYGMHPKAGNDPVMAQAIEQIARDIISAPGLKPADIRIVLAEALGEKVPTEFRPFVKWAMGIGIGRTQAYEAAVRWCRPSDWSSSPEGRVVDTQS